MSNQPNEPVCVARYSTEFEAMLAKNMLTEAGIQAMIVGAMTAGFRAETPGIVKVMVPASTEEQALKLMIEFDAEPTNQDPNDHDSDTPQ